jgi:hypothetical protein
MSHEPFLILDHGFYLEWNELLVKGDVKQATLSFVFVAHEAT